jgi:hypothetical protein
MKSLPRVIFASVVLAVALSFWATWSSLHLGRGPAPLNQSPFLRDVVEPITIVDAMSFDDGGEYPSRPSCQKLKLSPPSKAETNLLIRTRCRNLPRMRAWIHRHSSCWASSIASA